MTASLATVRGLRVTLGGRSILDGIDADILRHQITALIGLNGSGKTTLLRALIRECPYQGEVRFFCGHDHAKHRPEHIGYVPQRITIDPRVPLTVREFFALIFDVRCKQQTSLFLRSLRQSHFVLFGAFVGTAQSGTEKTVLDP